MGVQLMDGIPTMPPGRLPPCVLHEDDDLLVVNKPAGWNTHSPSPHAGEGIYDWLRHREPRWASLSILHRLDKETSGVLVFGKGERANRSLTAQFTGRGVEKEYRLRVDRPPRPGSGLARIEARAGGGFRVTSWLDRCGEIQRSRPTGEVGREAVTDFEPMSDGWWRARPRTGRTHQIRVHAALLGMPIRGDVVYGGSPSGRVWLHAEQIGFEHPMSGGKVVFRAEPPGESGAGGTLAEAMFDPEETNAHRWVHGAGSGRPGLVVERLGEWILMQSEDEPAREAVAEWLGRPRVKGVYHKRWRRDVRGVSPGEGSPVWVGGEMAPERFEIRENGVRYEVSMAEGYSYGLFLDQRDNRRRLLRGHVAAGFGWAGMGGGTLLNCFAYTGGFSVCAASAGATTTTLDLSKKYLEWGRRNFGLNGLDAAAHDWVYGDCFDWLRRFAKKGRRFRVVVLDPPTFSRSKESGEFRADRDYGRLVEGAAGLVEPGGVLLASSNAARWEPEAFLEAVRGGLGRAGRRMLAEHYVPQPPDFPVTREEPAHLKTVWMRLA